MLLKKQLLKEELVSLGDVAHTGVLHVLSDVDPSLPGSQSHQAGCHQGSWEAA